jgi:hypothetical protein
MTIIEDMSVLKKKELFDYPEAKLSDGTIIKVESIAKQTINISSMKGVPLDDLLMGLVSLARHLPANRYATARPLFQDNDSPSMLCIYTGATPQLVDIRYRNDIVQNIPFNGVFDVLEMFQYSMSVLHDDLEIYGTTGRDPIGLARVWSLWEPELRTMYGIPDPQGMDLGFENGNRKLTTTRKR